MCVNTARAALEAVTGCPWSLDVDLEAGDLEGIDNVEDTDTLWRRRDEEVRLVVFETDGRWEAGETVGEE